VVDLENCTGEEIEALREEFKKIRVRKGKNQAG